MFVKEGLTQPIRAKMRHEIVRTTLHVIAVALWNVINGDQGVVNVLHV